MIRTTQSIAAVTIALLLAACQKPDDTLFHAKFYSRDSTQALSLFIDGQPKGLLPYFPTEPSCTDTNTDGLPPLEIDLPAGTYSIAGKDPQQVLRSSGTAEIGSRKSRLSGGIGGQQMRIADQCVTVGLWE